MYLHRYLEESARRFPTRTAIENPSGGAIEYAALDALSDRLRDRLVAAGVRPGDRVGVYVRKSIDAVGAFFGILKCGAAYVPVDPTAPASRNAYILSNCAVKVVCVEQRFEAGLREACAELERPLPGLIVLEGAGDGRPLDAALERAQAAAPAPGTASVGSSASDLAYILYTSGSTGKPKGVMISHENSTSFVEWCDRVFAPRESDRFSSHAPFHFDLSILDIYVSMKRGATLVLVPEEVGKEPLGLARLISQRRITIWYSAPSILSLLAQYGKLSTLDFAALRTVLFAGEVFPIVHLRSLRRQWSHPRYFNLYGPTETNVCTYYEVPAEIPEERSEPFPIGKACEHLQDRMVDAEGHAFDAAGAASAAEGELCIAGPAVMQGYWDLPELTAQAFLAADGGQRWYKTGDLVVREPDGNYRYVGRKDRMIKKRGYRVELGEIEACLYRHPEVREAAVVALPDEELGLRVRAHLSTRDDRRISLIKLKSFCSSHLPLYMVPDEVRFHAALPKTSTDKIDYHSLRNLA